MFSTKYAQFLARHGVTEWHVNYGSGAFSVTLWFRGRFFTLVGDTLSAAMRSCRNEAIQVESEVSSYPVFLEKVGEARGELRNALSGIRVSRMIHRAMEEVPREEAANVTYRFRRPGCRRVSWSTDDEWKIEMGLYEKKGILLDVIDDLTEAVEKERREALELHNALMSIGKEKVSLARGTYVLMAQVTERNLTVGVRKNDYSSLIDAFTNAPHPSTPAGATYRKPGEIYGLDLPVWRRVGQVGEPTEAVAWLNSYLKGSRHCQKERGT